MYEYDKWLITNKSLNQFNISIMEACHLFDFRQLYLLTKLIKKLLKHEIELLTSQASH